MKNIKSYNLFIYIIALIAIILSTNEVLSQDPWKSSQLMAPSELNKIINNSKAAKTYIFSIGFQSIIKNSIDIGAGMDKANINKLKLQLKKLPKDANIVIYCGCCPFKNCPNVRPVFNLLNEMGFKNHKLLDLPQNIKVDWIDKGYSCTK
ncbi:MAG: rhodanese-like domain-containing protein [Candidatus Kapabacteria bacterium]|nr:rhodanese-like domain-containing protein [Candidatus Kapabacteria bacterium]